MPSNTENVKLGVCSVTFDGVDLGYTKGGVEVEVQSETKVVNVDQFGTSPVNEIIMGRSCSVKVPLAETTVRNLARIMPGAVLVESGGAKATGSVTFADVGDAADTVTINGVVFTAKAAGPLAAHEFLIGASATDTAASLIAKINASIDPRVSQLVATAGAAGVVTLTADDKGVEGNAVTLAKSGTDITVSGATLTGGTAVTGVKVEVPNAIGTSLLQTAKKLVLHPKEKLDSDRSEDFTIPLANTAGALQFSYQFDNERVFPCDFKAYPNPVSKVLYVYGDESVTAS